MSAGIWPKRERVIDGEDVQIIPIGDIDDTEAAETVRFGLDGRDYEIDLSTVNAEQLREVLALYSSAVRKSCPEGRPPAPPPALRRARAGRPLRSGSRSTATTSPTAAGSTSTSRAPTGPRRRMGTLKY